VVAGGSLMVAKAEFLKKFREKTVNNWEDRARFVKHNGKYMWLEMAYDDDDDKTAGGAGGGDGALVPAKPIPNSKLDPRLRSLMELICDLKMMEAQMKEIGFDARKMPLGKLSPRVIREGYECLNEIMDVINGKKKGSLVDLSSRFYTTIPHDMGFKNTGNFILDTVDKVKPKIEMVQSLADIEIATRILEESKALNEHPADAHYHKLK
jgi:poly [ADP-ribose] polymerase 2/3/4